MALAVKRDMLFSVLFIGDEHLIRHLVTDSARRLGAAWTSGIQAAGLVRLRAMFFLLVDRDPALKEKLLEGWPELCVSGVETGKAGRFFQDLRPTVIEPWLVDERRTEGEFVSNVVDLYLVS